MEKTLISLENLDSGVKSVNVGEIEFIVKSRLNLVDFVKLISTYMNVYRETQNVEQAPLLAEMEFRTTFFDLAVVNIKIEDKDYEKLISTSLYDKISEAVENYWDLKELLWDTLKTYKEGLSLESNLSALIGEIKKIAMKVADGDGVLEALGDIGDINSQLQELAGKLRE